MRGGGKAGVPLLEEGVSFVTKDITAETSQDVSPQNYPSCHLSRAKILLQYWFDRIHVAVRKTLWLFDTSLKLFRHLSVISNYSPTAADLFPREYAKFIHLTYLK